MPKRALHIVAICIFAVTMLGASSPDTRVDKIGHKLVCQCGCTQILMECNHVGCPVSPVMIDELRTQVANGLPDAGVLNFFIAKYGAISLAAPMRGGFDDVAWIVPFAVFVIAIFGVALLIRFWKRRNDNIVLAGGGAASLPPIDAMQDRIRRDTDYDNWSQK
jgi:cytochrome c-type biogenesis protein CcmH/NrfF